MIPETETVRILLFYQKTRDPAAGDHGAGGPDNNKKWWI